MLLGDSFRVAKGVNSSLLLVLLSKIRFKERQSINYTDLFPRDPGVACDLLDVGVETWLRPVLLGV